MREVSGAGPTLTTARIRLQPIYEFRQNNRTVHALEASLAAPSGETSEGSAAIFASCETASELAQVDRAYIQTALASARDLPAFSVLAIKVHGFSLAADGGFLPFLQRLGRSCTSDPSRIVLEVGDFEVWWSHFELDEILKKIRRIGMRIALEESGLCPPDVRLFRQVRPDYFKIDRQTVCGMWTDPLKLERFKDLVKVADSVGTRVIASGVEDEADLYSALGAGAELAQGNHLSVPLPVAHWKRLKFEPPLYTWNEAFAR